MSTITPQLLLVCALLYNSPKRTVKGCDPVVSAVTRWDLNLYPFCLDENGDGVFHKSDVYKCTSSRGLKNFVSGIKMVNCSFQLHVKQLKVFKNFSNLLDNNTVYGQLAS